MVNKVNQLMVPRDKFFIAYFSNNQLKIHEFGGDITNIE